MDEQTATTTPTPKPKPSSGGRRRHYDPNLRLDQSDVNAVSELLEALGGFGGMWAERTPLRLQLLAAVWQYHQTGERCRCEQPVTALDIEAVEDLLDGLDQMWERRTAVRLELLLAAVMG